MASQSSSAMPSSSSNPPGNQERPFPNNPIWKRPAAAMDPDEQPEVLDWDDPEVLDFEEDEPQFIGTRPEKNSADLASTDNTDVPTVDYSHIGLP